MYGNPANLLEIENFTKENNIILIDDGAQSFGAKLNDRFISTFGDGGFFSFSPGKPTAGHLGAFFWTKNKDYRIKRSKHTLLHYIIYLDFYFNRLNIYKFKKYKLFKLIQKLRRKLENKIDIKNDEMANFEEKILGGILYSLLNDKFEFRQRYINNFNELFKNNSLIKPIKSIRGTPSNHKIIFMTNSLETSTEIRKLLEKNKIYYINGYRLLTDNLKELPNSEKINGRVFELPVEDDSEKMNFLFNIFQTFLK